MTNYTGVTFQIKVVDHKEAISWYEIVFNRKPDFVPHEGFAEWEVLPGTWIQVAEGRPAIDAAPIRIGVVNIDAERERIMHELVIQMEEIQHRDGVPARWCTFKDPSGNLIGFYEEIYE